MQKLNELNKKLQGKGEFPHELYLVVKAFQIPFMHLADLTQHH